MLGAPVPEVFGGDKEQLGIWLVADQQFPVGYLDGCLLHVGAAIDLAIDDQQALVMLI